MIDVVTELHTGQIRGFDFKRIIREHHHSEVREHRSGAGVSTVVLGHCSADDPAERIGAPLGDLRQSGVRRERVLDHGVQHRTRGVDIELRAVDLVDLHAAQRLAHKLGITEVFGAVGRQGHRRAERGDEPEVHEVGFGIAVLAVDDDVVGLDIFVPEPAPVVRVEDRDQVVGVSDRVLELCVIEPIAWGERVHALGHC